jgi:hypothetical protein
LLQRHVQLAERDLLGRRAERLEDVDRDRISGGADLQPVEITGLRDRLVLGGDVADAVVPPAERDDAQVLELARQLLADRPVHDRERLIGVFEQEGQTERRKLRNESRGGALAVGG